MNIAQAYCSGRAELARALLEGTNADPHVPTVVQRILWSPAYCEADGQPRFFFQPLEQGSRLEVIGFEDRPIAVERVGKDYLRLRITACWYVPFQDYRGFEDYFAHFSKKTKKKLHWMKNSLEREGVRLVPARTESDFREFLDVYQSQRPDSAWVRQWPDTLIRVFAQLERMGKSRSYLLKDKEGTAVAGSLGYLTDGAYHCCLLARRVGMFERQSPGFFMLYRPIQDLFAERPDLFCVLGPGAYQYKHSLLARPLPIYRYERRSWSNAASIVRLYLRAISERRKERDGQPNEE